MIFNILHDLETQFPSLQFITEGRVSGDSQASVLLRTIPGSHRKYPDNRVDDQLNVNVQHGDQFQARKTSYEIFLFYRERFGVTLQPHPDDDTDAVPIFFARIAAQTTPQPLGRLDSGLFSYVTNYVLTYEL